MSGKTVLNGACMCGAVTVEATPQGDSLHACHCDMCRAWTGSGMLAFTAAGEDVVAQGPIKTRTTSDWAERAWCDTCGSALWCKLTIQGPMQNVHNIAAGLFKNAAGLSLTSEIYIDRKPGGYAYVGDHAKMTKAEVEALYASPDPSD